MYILTIFDSGDTFYVGTFPSRPEAIKWAVSRNLRFEAKQFLTPEQLEMVPGVVKNK